MIKKSIILVALLFSLMIPASSVFAVSPLQKACASGSNSASFCHTGSDNNIYGPKGILSKAINLISVIIGTVAVFAIIVAGIMFITSGGDPAKVAKAKDTIIYVLIGIAVVALAQTIDHFVIYHLAQTVK